jgi:hypothetical protein
VRDLLVEDVAHGHGMIVRCSSVKKRPLSRMASLEKSKLTKNPSRTSPGASGSRRLRCPGAEFPCQTEGSKALVYFAVPKGFFPDLKPLLKALVAIKQPILYFGGFTGLVLLAFGSFQNRPEDHVLKCWLMGTGAGAFFFFGTPGIMCLMRGENETQAMAAKELPKVVEDHKAQADIRPLTQRPAPERRGHRPQPPDENLHEAA